MGAFRIRFFDKPVANFTGKHLFVIFFLFNPDGLDFPVFHTRENNLNAHVVAL